MSFCCYKTGLVIVKVNGYKASWAPWTLGSRPFPMGPCPAPVLFSTFHHEVTTGSCVKANVMVLDCNQTCFLEKLLSFGYSVIIIENVLQ